jgi:alpha-L-rhamnosidase
MPTATPRLSWRFSDRTTNEPDKTIQNWYQAGYQVDIRRPNRGDGKTLSFKVDGDCNAFAPWPDAPLVSRERAFVRVRAFGSSKKKSEDDAGNTVEATSWTEWKVLEAALLCPNDWKAKLITVAADFQRTNIRPIRLRKIFRVPGLGTQWQARLYITSLGVYEAYLNGQRIGDECLAPGWTSFHHRLQYNVYDVGNMLQPKGRENNLAIEVASGMYAGRLLWNDEYKFAFYGDHIAAFAQLEVRRGEEAILPHYVLATDSTWEGSWSPLLSSSIYDGEQYMMELEQQGWNESPQPPMFGWQPVKELPMPKAKLVATSSPPVRVTQTVRATNVFMSPGGKVLVDFGQNLVGKVIIHSLSRPDGHTLRIRHAEVLEGGELGVRPLRTARATDIVTFGGQRNLRNWSPRFTYHGFRYVEVEGWNPFDVSEPLTMDSISALVMHSDLARTGHFECSNPMLNQLHENVVWSTRGNMFSIPTDCPQRDERLGWTGDIQIFCPTAAFLFDVDGLLSNWMQDVILDQKENGGIVPLVVPDVKIPWPSVPQAIWDDVVIILPWTMFTWFGDKNILEHAYPGMKEYLDKTLRRGNDGLWDPDLWQLGDWLDPGAPPHDPGLARTDGVLVADEYLLYVTGLMAKISRVVGKEEDEVRYSKQLGDLRASFKAKYMAPSGLLVCDSQTALALALTFSLYSLQEEKQRETAAQRLGRLVRYAQFRVSTGFAGTPQILHALSQSGQLQLAYRMLLGEDCPSWLYPVRMGATSIWERWDSMLEDGTVNPGEMTSFNHYALGSVASWLHAVVGGISPIEPGWKRFKIQPRPGGDVRNAKVEFLSSCGQICCSWTIVVDSGKERFHLLLRVPKNSTAEVTLPDGNGTTVGSGQYCFDCDYKPEGQWPPRALYTAFR